MNAASIILIIVSFNLIACQAESNAVNPEKIKAEIIKAEKDFNDMAQKEGIPKAFLAFAAEDGVIKRNNKIYKGKAAIRQYFDQLPPSKAKLTWEPEFVDVSASGDLAYTYGAFTYSGINAAGDTINNTGIFHTVWKKQSDGSWKYVWD